MTVNTQMPDQYLLNISRDTLINAPAEIVFDAMLEQIGPGLTHPDGSAMPMKLEAWPGGRWFRDLGNNNGHLWGHVQVIKPPTLLEISGPLFMSYPALSHVQYRIAAEGKQSRLTLLHRAIGDISPEHRQGVSRGWESMLEQIKARATR